MHTDSESAWHTHSAQCPADLESAQCLADPESSWHTHSAQCLADSESAWHTTVPSAQQPFVWILSKCRTLPILSLVSPVHTWIACVHNTHWTHKHTGKQACV